MKVVALISGGKDSCFNVMQCIAAGHEVIALANLEPCARTEIDSYMYQSVGHEAIDFIAKSMQLPLYRKQTTGTSHHRDMNYVPTENDEVEDLYELLELVKSELNIQAVSVGAILSDYQRIRVENVCKRLDLVPLAYLWQRDQNELLQEMIKCQIDAIIIKVAALGLEPSRHLGRSLRLVEPHLQSMHEKYGLNMCGEGGEYETLVLDCPLYSSRIIIEESEVIMHSDDPIAPVGYLKLNKLKLETKLPQIDLYSRLVDVPLKSSDGYITDQGEEASEFIIEDAEEACEMELLNTNACNEQTFNTSSQFNSPLICGKSNNGWLSIGGISGNSEDCHEAIIEALEKLKCRHALHVQSLSHWAPANIGPYSQAVRVGELIHVSGQIGLVPGSMELVKGGIKCQCQLALRHIRRILNVMDSNVNLRDVVQAICFVTDIKLIEKARKLWEAKTNNAIVDYIVVSALPRDALVEWHVWAHKHNNAFEYEETGKCIDNWSVSIYRRWNYENNIAAIVCHLDHPKEIESPITPEICNAAIEYLVEKLQSQQTDKASIISLKIFFNVQKQIPLDSIIEILNDFKKSTTLVYTLIPVVNLYNEHAYLSVCGVRIQ